MPDYSTDSDFRKGNKGATPPWSSHFATRSTQSSKWVYEGKEKHIQRRYRFVRVSVRDGGFVHDRISAE